MEYLLIGIFLAAGVLIVVTAATVWRRIRRLSRQIFGTADLAATLMKTRQQEAPPRSVSGCDRILLPRILEDFPDFDVHTAKSRARDYVRQHLAGKEGVRIHRMVISGYLPSAVQKTIVFQAAAEYREKGQLLQKRYNLYDTYLLPAGKSAVALNCPNCGAALGYGETVCPYCDSRVVNATGSNWKFTEILEN